MRMKLLTAPFFRFAEPRPALRDGTALIPLWLLESGEGWMPFLSLLLELEVLQAQSSSLYYTLASMAVVYIKRFRYPP